MEVLCESIHPTCYLKFQGSHMLVFLLFVKSIKVFDEKYFEFNSQNK
ncbi:hypothetical protein SSUST3_1754 [Streptococcus suis ST3]|nr:hypothetical protein SSUST3_1754 [Streptococcus suis ST3]AGW88103.1 hypothetical protein YB51_8655 [Streptococcus suis YB51]